MNLTSRDIIVGENIDPKFTCDGQNLSPHLKWDNFPENTQSFAISVIDRDSKAGTWIHWYVVNIPKNIDEIMRGGPIPGEELENDFGNKAYGGPCPEEGEHRYFFTIYAIESEKIEGINKKNFEEITQKYLIDSAELMGKYRRKNC